ncbi:hypothetical protein [Brachybacterium sp. GPGPB12]|uniref:hypothetical protein n=1 Tax=Brachybacterium sp. GPGPB12 TaxID=3023517 RepID=UPI00313456B0
MPALDQVVTNVVTDPYSVGLTVNSTHSVLVDLDDPRWAPEVWTDTPAPEVAQFADQTIYEMHLRDFSAGDEALPEGIRGSYAAVGHPDSAGSTRLEELAQAGMTTVHLLPTFDIATIEEDRAAQPRPDIPADAGPASPRDRRPSRPSRARTPTTGATIRCTTWRLRARTRPRATRSAASAPASSAPWWASRTAWAYRSCSTRCTTTPPRTGSPSARSSTASSPATTSAWTSQAASRTPPAART